MRILKSISVVIFMFYSILNFGQEKISVNNESYFKPLISENSNVLLYVVNGTISENSISSLNPNDIKFINILKPTEAAAIYGEKGKNGVILIQTKNISKRQLKKVYKIQNYKADPNVNDIKIEISGIITDCEKLPLAKVNILNLNSKESSKSDSIGKFKIVAHQREVLKFSLIGYESQIVFVRI